MSKYVSSCEHAREKDSTTTTTKIKIQRSSKWKLKLQNTITKTKYLVMHLIAAWMRQRKKP